MPNKISLPGEGRPIGKITHYFSKIGIAVVKLSDNLKVGDSIRVIGGGKDFEQIVESIEIDNKKTGVAKSGEDIGLKIDQKVKKNYSVYKL